MLTALLLPLLGSQSISGSAWTEDQVNPLWVSAKTARPPLMDGTEDLEWRKATPLKVTVREAMGGDYPQTVELRALHTETHLFVLAKWSDATRSDMRDPYIWNAATSSYDRPSRPDDQFALEFPISGDFAVSMLTTERSYKADVWHWKAGRGNPIGWVDDKYHVISSSPIEGSKGVEHKLHSNRSVWILRAQDAGTSPYAVISKPGGFQGDLVDSFAQQEPSGSLADVRGKGRHQKGGWVLEMSRRLDTGHSDDAPIKMNSDNVCAIALLNDELYEEHSVSTSIRLRLGS